MRRVINRLIAAELTAAIRGDNETLPLALIKELPAEVCYIWYQLKRYCC